MVFQLTDFTDSEASTSPPPAAAPSSAPSTPRQGRASASTSRNNKGGGTTPGSSRVSASPRSQSGRDGGASVRGPSSAHPLRITLRAAPSVPTDSPQPSRSHLSTTPAAPVASSQRSSLSPPPPITLKLSRQSLAEKATYSSSEDEMALTDRPLKREAKIEPELEYDEPDLPLYYEEDDLEGDKSFHPKSKPKKAAGNKKLKGNNGNAFKKASSAGSSAAGPSSAGAGQGNKVPVNNRKTYDWLAPSSVSASHSGPAGRSSETAIPGPEEGGNPSMQIIVNLTLDDSHIVGYTADYKGTEESKVPHLQKKKPKKKAADGEAAVVKPKAPKKETKKGPRKISAKTLMAESLLDLAGSHEASPSVAGLMSHNGSPEPSESASRPRADSPSFEKADPVKLGFPVFSKPIVTPQFALGTMPKVTQTFAHADGGDGFMRKEKSRSWKDTKSTFIGIGGGTLVYKTWARGPNSELFRLIQADKAAKEIQRAAKKSGASQPLLADPSLPLGHSPDKRPALEQTNSSESVVPQLTQGDEEASEVGEEATGTTVPAPKVVKKKASATALGGSKPKAKPRKSKLAQEIVPVDVDMEAEAEAGVVAE